MKNKFVARKWTDSPLQPKQFDVVYLDFKNNNQHYVPEMCFLLENSAKEVAETLNKCSSDYEHTIAKQWPVDGAIPDEYLTA